MSKLSRPTHPSESNELQDQNIETRYASWQIIKVKRQICNVCTSTTISSAMAKAIGAAWPGREQESTTSDRAVKEKNQRKEGEREKTVIVCKSNEKERRSLVRVKKFHTMRKNIHTKHVCMCSKYVCMYWTYVHL